MSASQEQRRSGRDQMTLSRPRPGDGARKRFDGLTLAQSDAFARIATSLPPRASRRTLATLLERGLIEAREVRERTPIGLFTYKVYDVPLEHHMRWCAWCAAQLENADAASHSAPVSESPTQE